MADSATTIRLAFSNSKLIKQLPESLRAYALARCLDAAPRLEMIPNVFGEYTDHSVDHSCTVLRLADKLAAQNHLTKWEILIFVLAAFYHDIGMSCTPEALTRLPDDPLFQQDARYIEELVLPTARLLEDSAEVITSQVKVEFLRRYHGERGMTWITKTFPPERPESIVEGVFIWDLVSRVCIGHTREAHELKSDAYPRISTIGTVNSVDVRFLACLLRLADICHLSRDRAMPHLRQEIKFMSRRSQEIWEATGDIAGVDVDEKRAVIIVSAQSRSFERHRMISKFVAEIEVELQTAHRLLADTRHKDHRFPWIFVDDTGVKAHPAANYAFEPNAHFHLVQDRIINLLMGSKLYADPLYSLRECLQNAIDAIRVLKIRDRSVVGRVVVQQRTDLDGPATLEIFDNGTGMDREICLRHLLSVGSCSFAATERRYREWGNGEAQLIAQHGIGFLSCFMLADRVDVFSKYPDADRVHLVLDSPTWVGEFRTTREADFPRWSSDVLPESNPWDERHGTCVRLYLKTEISKLKLMHFLAKNILRLSERVVVIYGGEVVDLVETWSTADRWRDEKIGEDASLAELRNHLFLPKESPPQSAFFSGPPRDRSLEPLIETDGDIRGLVRLKHKPGDVPRLSQEGILVRDGASSLFSAEAGDLEAYRFPYYFDVDVRGVKRFELDAERARIIDRWGALTAELLWWVEERGLRAVGRIESPLYFPCGNFYYHGGADLLAEHSGPTVVFHDVLRRWYSPERLKRVFDRGRFDEFVKAKLFASLGSGRNEPVSIADMLCDQHFVLMQRVQNSDLPYTGKGDERLQEQLGVEVITEIGGIADLDKVVFLPDFPESFTLPLSTVFHFEWLAASRFALLGRLIEKDVWEVPTKDPIDEKFEAVGRFLDSEAVLKAMRSGGRKRSAGTASHRRR